MTIKRINKIKGHKIFRDFTWRHDLPDFKTYNLLYGWNGTGKSTLSNLFRAIEKRDDIGEGEVEFFISENKVNGGMLSTNQVLPNIRVFNKDFVEDNVFTSHGAAKPIFYIGQISIERQKEIEIITRELERAREEVNDRRTKKDVANRSFEDYKTSQARVIKEVLRSSGEHNKYSNYNKRLYEEASNEISQLPETDQKAKVLSDVDFNRLRGQIEEKPLDRLGPIRFNYPDTVGITTEVTTLLGRTVVSEVIESLKVDRELSEWTKVGLEKHKKENSKDCLFCEQPLPDGRIQELEGHFNDEYNRYLSEIERLSRAIDIEIDKLDSYAPPRQLRLYDHLTSEFDNKLQDLTGDIKKVSEYLKVLREVLNEKAAAPFQQIIRDFSIVTGDIDIVLSLNEIINSHNHKTDEFESNVSNSRKTIEESLVSQNIGEYKAKEDGAQAAENTFQESSERIDRLESQLAELERDTEDHLQPAHELNEDIRSYLGTSEITFEAEGNGYRISRNGVLADGLSEGEKTAITFLYFLKSLGDRSFSAKDGIVVIDDPVSSLDSGALFHAFGFMRERTKDVGQLFVLTHNYSFFRQVKNWFNYLDKRLTEFYMLTCHEKDGVRNSSITELDHLLSKFESEYHYLFNLVYMASKSENGSSLQQNYHLPNVARRLLESFLAFRQPSKTGNLFRQLEDIEFDSTKKHEILRFLNTHSHPSQILDPDHDLTILHGTKKILNDLLSLIRALDSNHFEEMMKIIDD